MEIIKNETGSKLDVRLVGRLDTRTAPTLAAQLSDDAISAFDDVTLDFQELRFISSAGIRVLLLVAKSVAKRDGSIKITNANGLCYEALDATGMTDIIETERL